MPNIKVKFVDYNSEFLDLSWKWLNDPEIKKMTMTPDFTKVEQLDFFEKLPFRDNYKIWGVQYNDEKIGVIGLKNISEIDMEYFGYIGVKKYWGKGISKQIFEFISRQENKKIYLFVSRSNSIACNAYFKNGFIVNKKKSNDKMLCMELKIE
ncbi:TPA: GNAT family N-acetyltransferase [Photobacterium damselae]